MRVKVSAVGAAPVEVAWERYDRVDAWPTWAPHLRRVECDHQRLTPGMTGTVHGPGGVHADFTVETVLPDQRAWSWRVQVMNAVLRLHHRVRPHPRGTITDLDIEGPAIIVCGYAPVARYALGRLVSP